MKSDVSKDKPNKQTAQCEDDILGTVFKIQKNNWLFDKYFRMNKFSVNFEYVVSENV